MMEANLVDPFVDTPLSIDEIYFNYTSVLFPQTLSSWIDVPYKQLAP